MRDNTRLRGQQRFDLSFDVKQAFTLLAAALVVLGGVFLLGFAAGRKSAPRPSPVSVAPQDPLAHLDEPAAAPKGEPQPELKGTQALTDGRSLERSLPPAPAAPVVAAAARPLAGPRVEERSVSDSEVILPPSIPADASAAPAGQVSAASTSPATPSLPQSPSASEPPAAPQRPLAVARPSAPAARPTASPLPEKSRAAQQHARRAESASHAAPATRPAAKGSYTIQVASAQHRADAERLAHKLAARKPRIVVADVPGKGRWYRVQIGAFDSRDAASRQLASLTQSGVHGVVTAVR